MRNMEKVKVRTGADLWIIVITTVTALGVCLALNGQLSQFAAQDDVPILWRLIPVALCQYGVAGLGITIVCMIRKEKFSKFGLNREHVVPAILLSCLLYIPDLTLTFVYGEWHGYCPFQQVWTTRAVLSGSLPVAVAGMLITAAAWGFFEGFNYAVITDKVNACFPSGHWWLDWGAIGCAVLCVLIHGAVGITPRDVFDMLAVIIVIYGSLMVRKKTENSWGLVFTFIFLWNAY